MTSNKDNKSHISTWIKDKCDKWYKEYQEKGYVEIPYKDNDLLLNVYCIIIDSDDDEYIEKIRTVWQNKMMSFNIY